MSDLSARTLLVPYLFETCDHVTDGQCARRVRSSWPFPLRASVMRTSDSARWPIVVLTLLAAALLALGFTSLVARYWHFYHLGTAGTGLALVYIVLPGSFVLAAACGGVVARRLSRRGVRPGGAALGGAGAAAIVLGSLFALEVWRTTALRSGEGEGAGDLAPFVASLVGRR